MGNCLVRLKEMVDSLPTAERKIANVALSYPKNVIDMQIDELASSCGVSTSSIVRLCKRMGYTGYKDFSRSISVDLALERTDAEYQDIPIGADLETIARHVCKSNIKAIENTLALLNMTELNRAIEAMCISKRIDFYGAGNSAQVAHDSCNKFLRLDKICLTDYSPHDQLLSASTLRQGDVAVFISYTGETQDTIGVMNVANEMGATTVSITKYGPNQLSEKAEIKLYADSTETLLRSSAMSSRISMLTIIDVLFTAVASRSYDKIKPFLDKTKHILDLKRLQR